MAQTVPAAQLVARCRNGDQEAWAALVERFSRYVYAIATQGFRLREYDAEDVFQEVFAKVYERLGSLRSDDAIQPWIAQLTRRVCVDRLRSGSREEATDEADLAADPDEDAIARIDEALDVHDAMAARSSTASSPATRLIERSARRSSCPRARSPAVFLAALSSCATNSREENRSQLSLVGR